jgi:hypothetical protein
MAEREGGYGWIVATAVCIVFAVLSGMAACSFSGDRKEAEALAERYFAAMQGDDIAGVLSLYSSRFYGATSRGDWLAFLNDLHARCGALKSHSLATWTVFNSFGANAGTRTTLIYDVQYSSCQMSEKMTAFKPDGGQIQIEAHFLTPKVPAPDHKGSAQTTALIT